MKHEEKVAMLVTAGDGPVECQQAVAHILDRMQEEADSSGLDLSIHQTEGSPWPRSAVVLAHGPHAALFSKTWCGTILWRMESQVRKHHKRANWFVGVFRLPCQRQTAFVLNEGDVKFSTLRAGGPGGQHQNTTDSAVRAVHKPSGLSVIVRDGKSQHQNKAKALTRLKNLADAKIAADLDQQKSSQNQLHRALERGNPLRRFKGARFKEC